MTNVRRGSAPLCLDMSMVTRQRCATLFNEATTSYGTNELLATIYFSTVTLFTMKIVNFRRQPKTYHPKNQDDLKKRKK